MKTDRTCRYALIKSVERYFDKCLYRVAIRRPNDYHNFYDMTNVYVDNIDTLSEYANKCIDHGMFDIAAFNRKDPIYIISDDSCNYIIKYDKKSNRVYAIFYREVDSNSNLSYEIEESIEKDGIVYDKVSIRNEFAKCTCYINSKLSPSVICDATPVINGSYIDPTDNDNILAYRNDGNAKFIQLVDTTNYFYRYLEKYDITLTINGNEKKFCNTSSEKYTKSKDYIKKLKEYSNDNAIKNTDSNIKFGDFEDLKDTIRDTLNKTAFKASEIAESIDNDKELSNKADEIINKAGMVKKRYADIKSGICKNKEESIDPEKCIDQMIEYANSRKISNNIGSFDEDIIEDNNLKKQSLMIYIASDIKIKDIKHTLKNLKSVIDQYDTVDIFTSFSSTCDMHDTFRRFIKNKIGDIIGRDRAGVIRNTIVLDFEAFKYIDSYDFCITLYSTNSNDTVKTIIDTKSLRNKTICILCRERSIK